MNIAHQLLLEYIRDKEIQKSGNKLLQAIPSDSHFANTVDNLTDEEKLNSLLDQFDQIDPTQNNQYVRWLIREYSRNAFKVEDSHRVQNVLKQFMSVKSKLDKKDINQYKFHDLESTLDGIFNADIDQTTDTEEFPKGTKVLYNGPLGWLVIPETEAASCELGRGTKWCTASKNNNMFNYYAKDDPLYIWRDAQEGGAKYQFHFDSRQFMDAQDRPISTDKLNYFRNEHPIIKKLFSMKEKEIAKDPKLAYEYAENIIKGRWPEGEPEIAKDHYWAYEYAENIIKGRWKEGEPAIAKDPELAYNYAEIVIEGRFPEGEPAIAKDPDSAYNYARYIIKGRWPEAEPAIASDTLVAYQYAYNVIKGRFPTGEQNISKDPRIAYYYAIYVIKGRFPAGEPAIAEESYLEDKYANKVMGDPDFWEKLKDPENHEYD